jgi:WXG100 family type VII secretion target
VSTVADAFSVDPQTLARSLADMDDFGRTAASLLEEIDSVVRALHITWEGEAAAAHAEAHRLWTHGAARMQEALMRLHSSGDQAHGNYTGAMDTNRTMWG